MFTAICKHGTGDGDYCTVEAIESDPEVDLVADLTEENDWCSAQDVRGILSISVYWDSKWNWFDDNKRQVAIKSMEMSQARALHSALSTLLSKIDKEFDQ